MSIMRFLHLEWYPLKLLFRQRVVLISTGLSLVLNATAWGLLFWGIPHSETSVFLHYTVLFGVDSIGTRDQVYAAPLWGLVILFVNLLVAWLVSAREQFMAQILLVSTVFTQLATLLAAFLLVFLNT